MQAKKRRTVSWLLVISVLLALLGQFYFAQKRGFMWDGIVLYALAMLAFALVMARTEGKASETAERSWPNIWQGIWDALHGNTIRLVVLLAGGVLVLYVSIAAGSRPRLKPLYDLLGLWVLGILCAIGAFVNWASVSQALNRIRARLGWPHPETVVVALLVLVTFFLRAFSLNSIPYVLSGDEASMGLEAINVIEGRLTNPFATSWFSNPTFYFFIQAAFLRLFGINTAALRLSSALISAATIPFLYIFARHYYGRWIAILATILFTTYHYAIHFGRVAISNTWDPFFALGAFYFLTRGLETEKLGYLLVSAVLTGLSIYFHAGSRLIIMIMLLYIIYWSLRDRDLLRENLIHLVIFCLIAFIVALPLLAYFRTHLNDMMAPWTRKAIFPTGWVDAQVKSTGKSVLSILFDQFLKAVLAFNYTTDPTFFYRPGIPLLQFVPSILFIFGMTYTIRRWREREHFLLIIWFLSAIIFGGMLLENPPSSHRIILAIPPVLICVALGMVKLSSYIQEALHRSHSLAVTLSLVLVFLASAQSIHFYFIRYTPAHTFAGFNTEVGDHMGRYLRTLGPSTQYYFFGPPRIYYNSPPIPFLAHGVKGVDIEPGSTRPIQDAVNPQLDAVFIFLPERRPELDAVRRVFPAGALREFRNERGQELFIAYEVIAQ